jgi:hypothetical protein
MVMSKKQIGTKNKNKGIKKNLNSFLLYKQGNRHGCNLEENKNIYFL